MTHFKIVHEVDCDVSRYWDVFFDEGYNRAIYAKSGVKERVYLEGPTDSDGGNRRDWKLRIMPTRDLPEVIKKLVKGDLGYIETSWLDRRANTIHVKIEPTLFTERTKIAAKYWIEPIGPGRLRRSFEGDISVDLALVGRKIEQFIIADIQRTYEVVAEATGEWCRANP